jgi:preprotein translocase subunit SecA
MGLFESNTKPCDNLLDYYIRIYNYIKQGGTPSIMIGDNVYEYNYIAQEYFEYIHNEDRKLISREDLLSKIKIQIRIFKLDIIKNSIQSTDSKSKI